MLRVTSTTLCRKCNGLPEGAKDAKYAKRQQEQQGEGCFPHLDTSRVIWTSTSGPIADFVDAERARVDRCDEFAAMTRERRSPRKDSRIQCRVFTLLRKVKKVLHHPRNRGVVRGRRNCCRKAFTPTENCSSGGLGRAEEVRYPSMVFPGPTPLDVAVGSLAIATLAPCILPRNLWSNPATRRQGKPSRSCLFHRRHRSEQRFSLRHKRPLLPGRQVESTCRQGQLLSADTLSACPWTYVQFSDQQQTLSDSLGC